MVRPSASGFRGAQRRGTVGPAALDPPYEIKWFDSFSLSAKRFSFSSAFYRTDENENRPSG